MYLCLNAKRNCFLEYHRDHHIQVEGEVLRFVVAFSHFNVLIIAHGLREKRTNDTVKSDERDKEAVDLLEKEGEKRARHMEEEGGSPLTRARTDRSTLSQGNDNPSVERSAVSRLKKSLQRRSNYLPEKAPVKRRRGGTRSAPSSASQDGDGSGRALRNRSYT